MIYNKVRYRNKEIYSHDTAQMFKQEFEPGLRRPWIWIYRNIEIYSHNNGQIFIQVFKSSLKRPLQLQEKT